MSIDSSDIAIYPFQRGPIFAAHSVPVALPSLARSRAVSMARGQTTHSSAKQICVPQLVELQATVLAKKTALVMGEEHMSYAELNGRANRVARYLQQAGVGPDVLVGVAMKRSLALIVAQLGVLKAGGAYVLLDVTDVPAHLAERRLSVVLTQQALPAHLPATLAHAVCLDADWTLLARYDTENPLPATSLANLAYVLYSSGSCVSLQSEEVTHTGLLNLVNWHHRTFAVSADACVTFVSSPARLLAGWEIWPYLAIGSTLCLPQQELPISPQRWRDWLLAKEITHAFLPAPLAESMLTLAWPVRTSLRYLFTGMQVLHRYPSASLPFALVII